VITEARIDADFIFDSCRGRRRRPVGSLGLPHNVPVFDVERLLAKAFGVGRLLRPAKGPHLDKKRHRHGMLTSDYPLWRAGSRFYRSRFLILNRINDCHANAHHRSPRWNGSGSLQRREELTRQPCRLGRRRNTERSLLRRRLVRSTDVSSSSCCPRSCGEAIWIVPSLSSDSECYR